MSEIKVAIPIHESRSFGRAVDRVFVPETGEWETDILFDVDGVSVIGTFPESELTRPIQVSLRFNEQVRHFHKFLLSESLTVAQRWEFCDAVNSYCKLGGEDPTALQKWGVEDLSRLTPGSLPNALQQLEQLISYHQNPDETSSLSNFIMRLGLSKDNPASHYKPQTGEDVIGTTQLEALLPVSRVSTERLGELALDPNADDSEVKRWIEAALGNSSKELQQAAWVEFNFAYRVSQTRTGQGVPPATAEAVLLKQMNDRRNVLHGFIREREVGA